MDGSQLAPTYLARCVVARGHFLETYPSRTGVHTIDALLLTVNLNRESVRARRNCSERTRFHRPPLTAPTVTMQSLDTPPALIPLSSVFPKTIVGIPLLPSREYLSPKKTQAAHKGQDYVTFRMKQLSEVAATKKRRRRNGIGRGRFNLARVL